jgi:hypothetical protein
LTVAEQKDDDERIDALLRELDGIAREHDHYEYGLPLHDFADDAPLYKLREAVKQWLADGVGTSDGGQQ